MQIDWLTVAAQIVNFLVLVWLLQRFLYGPITRAMARREERVAQRMRDADERETEAEHEANAYRAQQAALEQERERLMDAARDAAEQEGRVLRQAARSEVEARRREWQAELDEQRGAFLRDIRERSAAHFYTLAARALGELANERLEEQMAQVFIEQLQGLDTEARQKLADGCHRAGNAVTVRSRFALSPAARRRLTQAVQAEVAATADVSYEQSDDVACGLELKAGSQTVGWTLDRFLDSLATAASDDLARLTPVPG